MASAKRTVVRCSNSTITEAWALVQGFARPLGSPEGEALLHQATKTIPALESQPALVLVDGLPGAEIPPHWRHQVTWDKGRYLARFGHEYLSVHFRSLDNSRYVTFEDTLAAAVGTWLKLLAETIGPTASDRPIARMGFGYANQFVYPATGFDLAQHFRLSIGLGIGGADLVELLEVNTRLSSPDPSSPLALSVRAEASGGNVVVRTTVFAEMTPANLSFAQTESLVAQIRSRKDLAKTAFFELATDLTHTEMGAIYADP